ncbi:MAG: zinc-binding dehydrogenase [Gemmatimonadota bacterium]|nr:zinc-binding dehydrogenase [Gemmatimonadota bacterium]
MRAALFSEHGGPEVIRVAEVETPEPGPGEVRLAVRAVSLNHLDLWARRGLPFEIPMPHIGGSDVAGIVDAIGPGAQEVPLGTRVVVDPSLNYEWYQNTRRGAEISQPSFEVFGEHTQGGLADYCVVPATNLQEIPESVSFEVAGAAGVTFVTAWHALLGRGNLRPGETVLVTGASGGVSTAAIQIAKFSGARVYAVTSGRTNVDRVKTLGADVVYDRLEVDFAHEVWHDTGKRGVDIILDSVGEPLWESCLRSLAVGGRLVSYGGTVGPTVESDVRVIFWKQLSILGSTLGPPEDFRRVMTLIFDGLLTPVIYEVLPLTEARKAHELLESGKVFGKLVIVP